MARKTAMIIGSGIAGLATAEILSRNGWKVVVLEAQARIGGEASLATQKWYHTGWLYACLPNPAAMLGCYRALHLFSTVYGSLFADGRVNLDVSAGKVRYGAHPGGWFVDERITYFYALSTYEVSGLLRLYWPLYLRGMAFRRLRRLGYELEQRCPVESRVAELLAFWEDHERGASRYRPILSTDAKIETEQVIRSLAGALAGDVEIETQTSFSLRETNNRTAVRIGAAVHHPDLLIIASGKSIPEHLRSIGSDRAADSIKSIKSPIVVLRRELDLPDFVRFTPRVEHTINHIKVSTRTGARLSTIGSHYNLPIHEDPDISRYEALMCQRLRLDQEEVLGSYYGIKTEFADREERRYNHAAIKVNQNTFFALAGKFSQFPLLVSDFAGQVGLSTQVRGDGERLQLGEEAFAISYPDRFAQQRNGGEVGA